MKRSLSIAALILLALVFVGGQALAAGEAAKLEGKTVKSETGEELGTVESIEPGPSAGTEYLLLSQPDSDKLIPVLYSPRQVKMEGDEVILSGIDKQKLQNAPSITEDQKDMLSQPDFERRVRGYYGESGGQMMQPKSGEKMMQPKGMQQKQ